MGEGKVAKMKVARDRLLHRVEAYSAGEALVFTTS
jgi:hypothetical protein